MAFAPTPPRNNAPSQLLSLGSILASTGGSEGGGGASSSVALTNPPSTGIAGVALSLAGTVSPPGTAVEVGLAASSSVAPINWTNATISGPGWTASLTPSAAGTYYIWVQETSDASIQSIIGPITVESSESSGSVTITNPPSTGTAGTALSLAGTVSPIGTAVQVGLSTSASVAPSSWENAAVSGTGWTISLTPSSAGTYYIWAEQVDTSSVQAVSAAVTVATNGGGGSALSYSLIGGSGNGSLAEVTLTTATGGTVVDWTSSIVHGSTDVRPGVTPSAMGSIAACSFWFDTSATNTTVPGSNFGNAASFNNNEINFYPYSAGYGLPTTAPPAPTTAGTYFGKYAMYNSSGTLLGVFATSAINIT